MTAEQYQAAAVSPLRALLVAAAGIITPEQWEAIRLASISLAAAALQADKAAGRGRSISDTEEYLTAVEVIADRALRGDSLAV